MSPRLSFFVCAALLSAATACSMDEKVRGGLAVVLETDLSLPKDLDRVTLTVTQGSKQLLTFDQPLGEMHLLFPTAFRIPASADPAPVSVHAIAYKGAETRVERSAVIQIPRKRMAMLRLGLNYLCVGTVTADGVSTCGLDQTCKQGACVPTLVPDAELPAYESGPWSSGDPSAPAAASGSGVGASMASGNCFDVLACFGGATTVALDPATCTMAAPSGAQVDHLNVAIKLPVGSEGICGAGTCWVALDAGDAGFRFDGALVTLPASICQPRASGTMLEVGVTLACNVKTSRTPACGAWTTVSTPVESPVADVTPTIASGVPLAAVGSACGGLSTMSCGMCGVQTRACQSGTWSEFSACANEALCVTSATMPCGMAGTQTCASDCNWGECLGQMCYGPATRACGNCGTQRRHCDNGVWSEWEVCGGQGVCAPSANQMCETGGTQACGGDCQWDTCAQQICQGAASEPCGMCGTRTRTCNFGSWGAWSECAEQGECMPDANRGCGVGGTQTCGGNCKWSPACTGQTCTGPFAQLCGNCGTQTRSCDSDTGQWTDWRECRLQGECTPTMIRACGGGGTQTCADNCRWDPACTGQSCVGASSEACGNCGTRSRTCDGTSGQWNDWGVCSDQGACAPGAMEVCPNSPTGTRTCSATCQWTGCAGECTAGQTESATCGNCNLGRQTRSCAANGSWGAYGVCSEGGCAPMTERQCANNSIGTQTCDMACQWQGTCTPRSCTPGAMDPPSACGNCGSHTRACNADGTWGVYTTCSNEGACTPNATQMCPNNQIGTQTCSAACQWQGACTAACNAPNMMCGSACVDPASDEANCGSCGRACAAGDTCMAGTCVTPCRSPNMMCGSACVDPSSDDDNCGTCSRRCGTDQTCLGGTCICLGFETLCGSTCVDISSDRSNCGFCGRSCASGDTCEAGSCVTPCRSPNRECGGSCIDPASDESNCGSCGNRCGSDQSCSAGTCVCRGTGTVCGTTCRDLNTDEANCGSCSHSCTSDQTCSGGRCICNGGATLCSGSCVDTSTSRTNCGSCGTSCAAGDSCMAGRCVTPCNSPNTMCGGACINTSSDKANCGSCGNRCPGSNDTCDNGRCMGHECIPGESHQAQKCGQCGSASIACGADGHYEAPGPCMGYPSTTEDRACGKCGTETRACASSGDWGGYGSCTGEGTCTPGDSIPCADSTVVTCGNDCRWVGECGLSLTPTR